MRREDWPAAAGLGPYATDCRYFTGYQPCRFKRLCAGCPEYAPQGTRILLINLDAMGDVARTTALLPALKRKYPESHLTWVTLPGATPILAGNPYLDEVVSYGADVFLSLAARRFDIVINVDKSRRSAGLAVQTRAKNRYGFGLDENGAIIPLNAGAHYQFWVGLDDELKFHRNRKTEQEMLAETAEVEFRRDPYVLEISDEERAFGEARRKAWGFDESRVVLGLNTGCSELYPYKRLPVEYQAQLADALEDAFPEVHLILLGGPEDADRNAQIARRARARVLQTPCTEGLRRGILYTDLADVVVSGDSLGMHLAIGRGKRVVAWFGLTCAQEIDFYDRGEAVLAKVDCRPCWRKTCDRPVKCNESVHMGELLAATGRMITAAREEKRVERHRHG